MHLQLLLWLHMTYSPMQRIYFSTCQSIYFLVEKCKCAPFSILIFTIDSIISMNNNLFVLYEIMHVCCRKRGLQLVLLFLFNLFILSCRKHYTLIYFKPMNGGGYMGRAKKKTTTRRRRLRSSSQLVLAINSFRFYCLVRERLRECRVNDKQLCNLIAT